MASAVMLAIETSQRDASVAVRRRDGSVEEEALRTGPRHADDLAAAIDRLFLRTGLSPRDLESLAISVGPGSFTGLRIGISTAKALAEVTNAVIVPVPSALVAAEPIDGSGPIGVALASKGESFWLTVLDRDSSGHWRISGQPHVETSPGGGLKGLRAIVADRFFPESAASQCAQLNIRIIPPQWRASACLAVGEREAASGVYVNPLDLSPLYGRVPEAVTLWNQRKRERQSSTTSAI